MLAECPFTGNGTGNVNGTRNGVDDAKSVSAQSLSKKRKRNDSASVSTDFSQPPNLKKMRK